jgi:ribosomal protein S2
VLQKEQQKAAVALQRVQQRHEEIQRTLVVGVKRRETEAVAALKLLQREKEGRFWSGTI